MSFHDILELTYVAGPVIPDAGFQQILGECLDRTGVLLSMQGFVLAGGNAIGTSDNVTMVKGTLVCDTTGTANGNSALVDTPLVALSAKGVARFRGDVGPLPSACVNEPNLAFLIRTAGGAWIANGAIRVSGGRE